MKDDSIIDAFYINLQKQINRTEKKSDWYRNYYYFTRILTIIIATTITIVSGVKDIFAPNSALNIVLFLGAVSAALLSLDTVFQFELKKSAYKLMLVELREIRSEFVFFYRENETNEQLKERLFLKYQSAMNNLKGLIELEKESSVKLSDLQKGDASPKPKQTTN